MAAADEFPLLSAYGLYAADIRGDGNCLFNALSDQIYGNQNEHQKIRARVIDYMREHAAYYKQFLDVSSGSGVRRNPKRKNAGAFSTPVSMLPPSAEDVDRSFEAHLQQMARGGTYGDNMEISAFSAAFGVDVKIYQRDLAYVISGGDEGEDRETAHIAYHAWEHYSSIRNVSGPHAGLPLVQVLEISSEDERNQKEKLAKTPYAAPWMIEVVVKSLPFLADRLTIKRTLEETKGSIDEAVSRLLDAEDGGSGSSQQDTSSVERDPDSEDDDTFNGPNKKQDRRLSRATRATQRVKAEPNMMPHLPLKTERSPLHHGIARSTEGDTSDHPPHTSPNGTRRDRDVMRIDFLAPRPPSSSPKDSDTASEYSNTSRVSFSDRSHSRSSPPVPVPSSLSQMDMPPVRRKPGRPPKNFTPGMGHAGAGGQRRVTARERKELKKAAQKAAARQRKQQLGGEPHPPQSPQHQQRSMNGGGGGGGGSRVMAFRTGKENTPVLEAGIKVLYI